MSAILSQLGPAVAVSESGCWVWQRSKNSHGYGKIKRQQRSIGAHCYVWELANGAVPAGLQLDHLCRNRACVNPDHLEPVTASENIRRGRAAKGAYDDCAEHGPKDFNSAGLIVCLGCKAKSARLRNAAKRGTEPPRHGTRSSYGVYKCRCDACVAAQHAYASSQRARAVLREEEL